MAWAIAAGDSSAGLAGGAPCRSDPAAAVEAGHRLAGTVIRYPGGIIPLVAMPADLLPGAGG